MKIKELAFTGFYKKVDKVSKKIQKIVFPNQLDVGISSDSPASLNVHGSIFTSGTISASNVNFSLLSGSVNPEGTVTGSVGDLYTKNSGESGTLWFKRANNNTTNGWGQIGPQRVTYRSKFELSTSNIGTELWIPFVGDRVATSIDFDYQLIMPKSGQIVGIVAVANAALSTSCDVEVHRATDGNATFIQIDSDLSMDLGTANTAAQSNSINVDFDQFDKIAINFQSSAISAPTEVLVMIEVAYD